MVNSTHITGRFLSNATRILFVAVTTVVVTVTTQAAAPVGQTVWIRATATGLFVSADQNRGTWAPLVADRSSTDAWEQFQVIDGGSGFIALRSIGTGLFVSADQNRGTFAPLVADRFAIGTWEQFTWTDIAGGAFTLRGRATNRFVSADLNRGAFAPLVSDRAAVGAWVYPALCERRVLPLSHRHRDAFGGLAAAPSTPGQRPSAPPALEAAARPPLRAGGQNHETAAPRRGATSRGVRHKSGDRSGLGRLRLAHQHLLR